MLKLMILGKFEFNLKPEEVRNFIQHSFGPGRQVTSAVIKVSPAEERNGNNAL